jgi:hypothetical protein
MVNTLAPSVVAPRAVRAVAAVFAPVPPFAIATIPVTFAAVPEVFWFNVGKSAATAIEGTPVPVVFLRIPVPNEDINVPLIFVTVAVRTPVLLAAVTSPVIEMVWSPVFVPLELPLKLEPDNAPVAEIVPVETTELNLPELAVVAPIADPSIGTPLIVPPVPAVMDTPAIEPPVIETLLAA